MIERIKAFFAGSKSAPGASLPVSGKSAPSLANLTSFEAYQNTAIPIADIVRKYSARPEAASLLRRFYQCSEASSCAVNKAQFLAQYTPRLYMRDGASLSSSTAKRKAINRAGVYIKSRPIDTVQLRYLRNRHPFKGVGAVSQYAQRSGQIHEVADHPFLTLINNPNPWETRDVFWGMDNLQREVFGNAYSFVALDSDELLPVQLRHMYGQHVRIVADKGDWMEGFEYIVPGNEPHLFVPEEVAHFKYGGSLSSYQYGDSWFSRVTPEMDILINAKAVELHRFQSGLRADLAFLTPEFDPAHKEDLRKEINRRATGVRNAGGFLILDGVTGIESLSLSNKDIEYSAGMERAARGIRNAAGIPEAMANLNQSNLASALQADGQYIQASIQPLLSSHAQQLTAFLHRFYDVEPGTMWVAFDNIVEPGEEENTKTTISLVGSDLLTVDEGRERLGYGPLGGDRGSKLLSELRAPTGMSVPGLPQSSDAITPVNAPEKPADLAPSPMGRPPAAPAADEEDTTETKAAPSVILLSEMACGCQRTKDGEEEDGADEQLSFSRSHYDSLKGNLEGWLRKGAETGKYSQDELHKALSPLHSIINEGGQDGIAKLLTVPGGEAAVAAMSVRFDVHTPEVAQYVNTYTVKLAEKLSAKRHEELRSAIARTVEEGQTPQEAVRTVQDALMGRSKDDAERIARTESAKAYNQGGLKAWKEAGVKGKKWLLAPFACPLCKAIATKHADTVGLDHVFFAQGSEMEAGGNTYRNDYEDIDAPPLHPQCRCTTVPSLD